MKAAVRSAALLGLGMLTAIARAAGPGAVDDARLLRADLEPENWLTHGGTWR